MPPVKGQRQHRGEERRKAILAAARELFARHGYHRTSLSEVADAVGITQPGVLHHYGTKENLLAAVITEFDNEHGAAWADIAADGGLASLRRFPELAQSIIDEPNLLRMFSVLSAENLDPDGVLHDYFVGRFRTARSWIIEILKVGQRRGEFRTDIDITSVGMQVLAFQDGALRQWLLDPDEIPLVSLYHDFVERLIAAIALEPVPAPRSRLAAAK